MSLLSLFFFERFSFLDSISRLHGRTTLSIKMRLEGYLQNRMSSHPVCISRVSIRNRVTRRISQTYLDIIQDLGFEQMVNFPTRQENTLDLVFTTHPGYKISCKSLPPIGEKSDHDIVLSDTSHQVCRAQPPRCKIYLWKKADVDGISSTTFMNTEFDNIESMWAALKTAVTTALDKHVPSKLSSLAVLIHGFSLEDRSHYSIRQTCSIKVVQPRRTHPWASFPCWFLAFINDLPESVKASDPRLFADDCLLFKLIKCDADAESVQRDLQVLEEWKQTWEMKFHPEKCQVIRIITNKRHEIQTT